MADRLRAAGPPGHALSRKAVTIILQDSTVPACCHVLVSILGGTPLAMFFILSISRILQKKGIEEKNRFACRAWCCTRRHAQRLENNVQTVYVCRPARQGAALQAAGLVATIVDRTRLVGGGMPLPALRQPAQSTRSGVKNGKYSDLSLRGGRVIGRIVAISQYPCWICTGSLPRKDATGCRRLPWPR